MRTSDVPDPKIPPLFHTLVDRWMKGQSRCFRTQKIGLTPQGARTRGIAADCLLPVAAIRSVAEVCLLRDEVDIGQGQRDFVPLHRGRECGRAQDVSVATRQLEPGV